MKTTKYVFYLFILFAITSCQKGCTCNKVIDSETERMTFDDVKVKVKVEKIQTTNRSIRRNRTSSGGCNCSTHKTTSFSFSYAAKLSGHDYAKEIASIRIDENTDIDHAFDWIKIKFSPDKKHFATAIGERVFYVFHILEHGPPFANPIYDTVAIRYGENINAIKWNNLSTPKDIAMALIKNSKHYTALSSMQRKQFIDAIHQHKAPAVYDFELIKYWPQNTITHKALSTNRIEENCKKSDLWKQRAIEATHLALKVEEHNYESAKMAMAINDKALLDVTDKYFIPYWPNNTAVDYYAQRFSNKKTPPSISIEPLLIKKADSLIQNIDKDIIMREITVCFDLLLQHKRTEHFDVALRNILSNDIFKWNSLEIKNFITKNYSKFDAQHQRIIVEEIPKLFPKASFMERPMLFEILLDKADCAVLKNLKQTYSDDLSGIAIPGRCE